MNPTYFRVLFGVLGVFLISGCQRASGPEVARVGRSVISADDFKSRLQSVPVAYQQYTATAEGRREFLNLLIREKVLLEEARRAGLNKEENYRKAIDQFKKKSEADLRDYQDGLLVEMILARLRSKDLAVTDADVRGYYDQNETNFTRPVEYQASHILVPTEAEAEQALSRLKKGESFEALARAISVDPATAPRGGKLAPFTKGSLMPEFENAVIPLKDGQISGVIKSSFGYHVIKRNGTRVLPSRSFEEAKDTIRNRLQREKFDQWVTKTTASMGVKIDDKTLASVTVAARAADEGRGSIQ